MAYPTEIRVPINTTALEVVKRILAWADQNEFERVPVAYDDGTTGNALIAAIQREVEIVEVGADIAEAQARIDKIDTVVSGLTDRHSALIGQRPL